MKLLNIKVVTFMPMKRVQIIMFIALATAFTQSVLARNPLLPEPEGPAPAIGNFQKVRTQFDGSSYMEPAVHYLQIPQNVSAKFPLDSCAKIQEPTDLTLMFFFQRDNFWDYELGSAFQFFQFEDSVHCHFIEWTTIECDTPDRQKLVVSYDRNQWARWLHFTLSISSKGAAYLQIRDGITVIAEDSTKNFVFQQSDQSQHEVCFGLCASDYKGVENGFTGGLRELYVRNEFIDVSTLGPFAINVVHSYKQVVIGYYRLQDSRDEFSVSEVNVAMPRDSLPKEDPTEDRQRGSRTGDSRVEPSDQLIFGTYEQSDLPVDVCPQTYITKSFVEFERKPVSTTDQQLSVYQKDLFIDLKQRNYEYTMSVTFFVHRNTCWSSSPHRARNECHIVLLDEVFMLYFSGPNQARFHFYADKNYFESQTPQFFVPFNQWVTLQLSMSQYKGYKMVMLDHEGDVLLQMSRDFNMHEQIPQSNLRLFTGFSGLASRFLLTENQVSLPTANYRLQPALFNVDFQDVDSTALPNQGSNGKLQLSAVPVLKSVPYQLYEYQQPRSQDTREYFDGITCNDRHLTVQMDSDKGHDIKFQVSYLNETQQGQSTVQFWFKFGDKSFLQPRDIQNINDFDLFEMESGRSKYWSMFFRDSYELIDNENYVMHRAFMIAPFGRASQETDDILMVFKTDVLENEDEFGWWHLSCSYEQQVTVDCIMHNSEQHFTQSLSLESNNATIPEGIYQGKFHSHVDGLSIKQFRFWSDFQTPKQVDQTRHHQGYFENLVYQSSFESMTHLLQPDFITDEWIQYDHDSKQLVSMKQRRYHAVCPPFTYYKQGYCYNEPVNKPIFAVFPFWRDHSGGDLFWLLTVEHSNFITKDVVSQLSVQLNSYDVTLNSVLTDELSENEEDDIEVPYFYVTSKWLRQENLYDIVALITDGNFEIYKTLSFIPSKCRWFVLVNSDSYSTIEKLEHLPGEKDITFYLELINNPNLQCGDEFDFYDEFDRNSLDFQFIIDGEDDEYFMEQPTVDWYLVYEDETEESLLGISATITKAEQYKLPLWVDIKILMTIAWTSFEFEEFVEKGTFQNAMFTLQLAPIDTSFVANVKANTQHVSRGQTLMLTANATTVDGVHPNLVQKSMSYKWVCPEELDFLCEGQSHADTIYIPYSEVLSSDLINFQEDYTFIVEATWSKPDGSNETQSAEINVMWYRDLNMPDFDILCTEVDVASSEPTYCKIVGNDFDAEWAIQSYKVEWLVTPRVANSSFVNEYFEIEAGQWGPDKQYIIVADIVLTDYPKVTDTLNFQFKTKPAGFVDPITPSEEDVLNDQEPAQEEETQIVEPIVEEPEVPEEETPIVEPIVEEPEVPEESQPDEVDTTEESTVDQDETQAPDLQEEILVDGGRRLQSVNQSASKMLDLYIMISEINQIDSLKLTQYATELAAFFESENQISIVVESYDLLTILAKASDLSREPLVPVLVKLNEQARKIQDQYTIDDVIKRLTAYPVDLQIESDEFQVTSEVFNFKTAKFGEFTQLIALDSYFFLNSQDMFWQFPFYPEQDFYMQSIAQKDLDNDTQVYLRVIDSMTQQEYLIGQLDGQAELSFYIAKDEKYRPNQTQCSGLTSEGLWSFDLCLTELDIDTRMVKCTCNMMDASMISLRDDFSKELGEAVTFQPITQHFDSENNNDLLIEIEGTSYFFVTVVIVISFMGILNSVSAMRLDRNDWIQQKQPTTVQWQLQLLNSVADKFDQSLEQVKLRRKDLFSYHVTRQSRLFYITSAIHPLFGPINTFNPTQSRLLRHNAYHLQINLFVVACMTFFDGNNYRILDTQRQDFVLDAKDLGYLTAATAVGSFLLLPLLSNTFAWLLSNELKVTPSSIEVNKRCRGLRPFFVLVCLLMNVATVMGAVAVCRDTVACNQYLMALSICGGLSAATFGTNMLRVLFNLYAPDFLQFAQAKQAREILKDLKFVGQKEEASDKVSVEPETPAAKEMMDVIQTEQPFASETAEDLPSGMEDHGTISFKQVMDQAPESARKEEIE